MKLYKIYGKELISVEVDKKTECFYFLKHCVPAFGFSRRIDKAHARLTPQQAIQEELNNKRTTRGALHNELIWVEASIKAMELLEQEYNP